MKLSSSLLSVVAVGTFLLPALTRAARAQAPLRPLPMPTKADETADAWVWVIAPPVGSRWQLRSFLRTQSSQITPAIGGGKAGQIESIVLQRLVADYDILSRDRFGATTMRVTLRDMDTDVEMRVNGRANSVPAAQNARLQRALDGASFVIKQAPDGVIWNVIGIEAMQQRILNAVAPRDAATRQQIQSLTQSLLSAKEMRGMVGQGGALPTYPIRAGESWAYGVELPLGLPFRLRMDGTRTINLLTPTYAFISDDAVYGQSTAGTPLSMPDGSTMVTDMSGLQGGLLGTSRVDRANGLTLEATLAQRLEGAMTIRQLDFVGKVKSAESVPLRVVTTGRVVMEPR